MKLWQLVSVMKNIQLIRAIASTHDEWKFVAGWLAEYDTLVDAQDRTKLDYTLSDRFVRIVLEKSDLECYLSNDGQLRSWRMSSNDESLPALEVFDRYGGEALEEAYEKGSVEVPHSN